MTPRISKSWRCILPLGINVHGWIKTLDRWREYGLLPDGAVIRNEESLQCKRFDAATNSFIDCEYVEGGNSAAVDIFPGHHNHKAGIARMKVHKIG